MSRKKRTPEENARRAKIGELLQEANISSMADIQSLFRETIAEFMENGLEAELDEELGYSKYDFRNKETDNSRNGHSSKRMKTSFGPVSVMWKSALRGIGRENLSRSCSRRTKPASVRTSRKRFYPCTPKE